MPVARRRSVLAAIWILVVLLWCFFAFVAFGFTMFFPCGGDGGQPYAAPASPAGRYCTSVERFFESGEPGELTTAAVYLSPVALLLVAGAVGIWLRSGRLLLAAGILAFGAIVLHVTLAFTLEDRCRPNQIVSGSSCEHY